MTRGAVVALGVGQCVNWGVLYYAFAVLVLPLERELGVSTWGVTGAFSLALLMSAMMAPRVGAWCDRGRAPMVMQAGVIAAAVLLALWTILPGVVALYLIWGGLGLCMALTLYEPAFVIVGRACADPAQRLRTLAAVTLFGGLASTVFLPLTALLVSSWGWRRAVLVLAGVLAGSTALVRAFSFGRRPPASRDVLELQPPPDVVESAVEPPRWWFTAGLLAAVSLASSAFSSNLVPALSERGISSASAAVLGGLSGVMQLPGRALLMNGGRVVAPATLLTFSLTLQAAGLCGVAFAPSMLVAATGTVLFALGGGLTTLVRPLLVQSRVGRARSGYLNGRIARQQQLARAAGPLAVAWLAGVMSYAAVFGGIAILFVMIAITCGDCLVRPSRRTGIGYRQAPAVDARRPDFPLDVDSELSLSGAAEAAPINSQRSTS